MSFTKHAKFDAEVLGVRSSNTRRKEASLDKFADFHDFRTEDGFLYARIRAISSRVNKNHDGWPSVELAGGPDNFDRISKQGAIEANTKDEFGYSTFVGKPVFVDHHNSDPDRARGVVVDAKLHIEDQKTSGLDPYYSSDSVDGEHLPPTWVELMLEIDAEQFPRLASAIIAGAEDPEQGIDGFSMGCDVTHTKCSVCDNEATTPEEFCNHIRNKGAEYDSYDEMGNRTSKTAYENCYGIQFFELSAVFDPADETALLREVIQREGKTASTKTAGPDVHPRFLSTPGHGYLVVSGKAVRDTGYVPTQYSYYIGESDVFFLEEDADATAWLDTPQGQAALAQGIDETAVQTDLAPGMRTGYGTLKPASEAPGFPNIAEDLPEDEGFIKGFENEQMDVGSLPETEHPLGPQTGKASGYRWRYAAADDVIILTPEQEAQYQKVLERLPMMSEEGLKTAKEPQGERPHAPEMVDTLRKEEVCPVCGDEKFDPDKTCDVCGYAKEEEPEDKCEACGSDMDGKTTCEICGWERPPEGLGDPDLEASTEALRLRQEENSPEPAPRNPMQAAKVRSEMAKWRVELHPKTAAKVAGRINPVEKPLTPGVPPATDEPQEESLSDANAPTQRIRTARQVIEAARKEKEMNKEAEAATGAPDAASPDKNVEVDAGAGGVMDPSNEQASKADRQVDVDSKGGTGVENVSADEENAKLQGSGEAGGYDDTTTTDDSGPTATWDVAYDSAAGAVETQASPVDGGPFPPSDEGVTAVASTQRQALDSEPYPKDDGGLSGGSPVKGQRPEDPSVQPQQRDNLMKPRTSPDNNSGPTKTWSGTDGNQGSGSAVEVQADPVTNSTLEGSEGVTSRVFKAFKLADLEVELGLTEKSAKYERVSQLEAQSDEAVQAALDYAERVRKAKVLNSSKEAKRMPSLSQPREASKKSSQESDEQLFL